MGNVRRRQAIVAVGALGAGAALHASGLGRRLGGGLLDPPPALAQTSPACVLTPEQTEGPYYVDDEPFRRRISEGRPGLPLLLLLKVVDVATCAPVPNAVVEVWHADASGAYSGVGGAANDTFMRGQQVTNAIGRARFRTVYPGWYRGRTVHVHVKVHAGGDTVHTGQLYFDDTITDQVYAQAPYSARGPRDTDNASDGIYADGGAESVLALRPRGTGYQGRLTLGVVV